MFINETDKVLRRLALAGALATLATSVVALAEPPASRSVAPTAALPGIPTDPAPPVDSLVAEALANYPGVSALRERLAAAREMVAPAGALADPMVEGMYTEASFPGWTVGRVEMSMIGVEVRQDLSRTSKRNAREAVAQADAAVREADIEVLRRQIVRDVRSLYARVFAIDRELSNLRPGRELLQLLEETTSSRYGTGEGDQEGLIKTQLMRTKLDERQTDLLGSRRVIVAALGRLLNHVGRFAIGRIDALETPAFPDADWEELAASASAEIAAKRKVIDAAEKRVAAAKLDLKANYSATAGAYYRGSLDPVVTLKFGVELPWRRKKKQEPLIRAAERELEAARRDLELEQVNLRETTTRIAAMKEQAEAQIRRYHDGVIPQSSGAFEAARSAYLTGRGNFSTLIEDFNLWLDARTELARRESELYSAWAELQALTNPAPEAPAGGQN